MSAQEQKPDRWNAFRSLDWYDGMIEFLFRFVAKTSEPLLAAGIVYSAADVLSKGGLGSTSPVMDTLWAVSQALAIESSGGVVLVYGLQSLKEHDYVKACLYLLLSALLAVAGGVMLFMQLADLENQPPDSLFMRGLFALRCVVSVGYIYLCRTKSMSFRNLDGEKSTLAAPTSTPAQPRATEPIDYQRLAQELAPLLQAVRTTIIEEVKASMTGPETATQPAQRASQEQPLLLLDVGKEYTTTEKLEIAYQQLLLASDGQRVSGRALAKQAHIDRQTCAAWLRTAHPESPFAPEVTATQATKDSQPEAEVTATQVANDSQREEEVTAAQATNDGYPETEVTATQAAKDSQPEAEVTATQTATNGQLEAEVTATQAAKDSQPEAEVTATQTANSGQLEEGVTATTNHPEAEVTATSPGPRKKAATTATQPVSK